VSRPTIGRVRANRRRYAALGMLAEHGPLTAKEIATECGYRLGTIRIHLVWLERHGLVMSCWTVEPESRRVYWLAPTYADKVNAPLSPVAIEALRAELASGNYACYRKAGER
jgi:DNA-binding transcriptional ArsR family regulator